MAEMFDGVLQPTHLVLILGIALIVFGPGKIGELGGQLGRGVREFREMAEGRPAAVPVPAGAGGCGACGAAITSGAAFCADCGAKVAG